MEGFIGEVKYFVGTYAPMNWVFCEGQQLKIAQYSAVYSIIGIQYGGDGSTYFNLPDFRGRMAICAGQGNGLSLYKAGNVGGNETIQIQQTAMPNHNHSVKCDVASPPPALKSTPVNNLYGNKSLGNAFSPGTGTTSQLNPNMVVSGGQSQGHGNMPPWLSVHFIICLYGYYPIRP